ncbi:MAG: aminotransferase class V-fold PLP-dependent enzyme, partial [Agathobacter sp.]|nr:aminotransferase class V-fold PLP-dependent enzyme [Agathobacter sp.]
VEEMYQNLEAHRVHLFALRDYFIAQVETIPGVTVHGRKDHNSAPHIVSVSIAGVRAEVILHTLEDRNIYVSAGSACSSNKPAVSHTLQSIGLKKELLDSTIRFSFSIYTTLEELDYALGVMKEVIPMLQKYTRR